MQKQAYPSFSIKWTIGRKENSAPAAIAKETRRTEESVPAGEEDKVPSRQEIRWSGKGDGGRLSLPAKIQ